VPVQRQLDRSIKASSLSLSLGLEGCGYWVGAVVGQKKVVGQVDLYPRAFSYGYGRKNVEKTVENVFSRISHADTESLADAIRRVGVEHGAAAKLRNAAEDTDGKGCSKDPGVVIIDLVAKSGRTLLIESFELVKADRVAIHHDESMKADSQSRLPESVNFASLPHDLAARGNEQVLTVSGIDIVGEDTADRSGKSAVKPVDEQGL